MKLDNNIQRYITEQDSLEDRLFGVVLAVGLVIVWISTVITFIEKLSFAANIGAVAAGLMLLAVVFVAYVLKKLDLARLLLCYIFNCFVIPLSFFTCGGIDSGMPLYMVAGLFLLVPVLKGIKRIICIVISLATDITCILISYSYMPGVFAEGSTKVNILAQLGTKARIVDMICSLILIGMSVMITTMLIMDAYQKERASTEELLIRLDELSKRDELTGLYNRRELFNFLKEASVITDERYYLCMIDIDHFKRLNDTYGHTFGDVVLKTLAAIMMDEVREENSEIVARYGGEEFLIILKVNSQEEAYRRIEKIRNNFASAKWDKDPDLVTTFSGGLARCSRYRATSEAISNADKLLYFAKENGRNRIKM
ncbi:MAG: GGDEF domain-containing protein [Lachnospiraceae bacterium]|nr:GGDEF domain-containing protein [Lachnospiraceae bacterium]